MNTNVKMDDVYNQTEANASKGRPGRPIVEGSARQQKLKEMQERAEANGGEKRLGRPPVPGSKRQQQIEVMIARLASGEVIKRGRPAGTTNGSGTPKKHKPMTTKQIAEMELARRADQARFESQKNSPVANILADTGAEATQEEPAANLVVEVQPAATEPKMTKAERKAAKKAAAQA